MGRFVDGEPPELERFRGQLSIAETAEPAPEIAAEFGLAEADYARRIAAIHDWIRAGDVYQLNFTAPMRFEAPGSAAALYARLRARQPVDYGAFLHWQPSRHILSFSPELFFRVEEGGGTRRIVTRPMKGTAPRGRTTREDRDIAEWLHGDAKNRSENVMIVDLVRNDLGRVAQDRERERRRALRRRALPHALADDLDRQRGAAARGAASTTFFARCFPAGQSPARPKCGPCS